MFFGLFGGHKCKICGKDAKDELDQFDGPNWFCRSHLMELFAIDFLAYSDKMVIFHPEFEKLSRTLYGYYPRAEMDSFTFKKEVKLKLGELLGSINGHCAECQKEAQVLYFKKGYLDYSGSTPHIEKATPFSGELLCLDHALGKIKRDLESNPGSYSEGLFIPYAKAGMYVSNF